MKLRKGLQWIIPGADRYGRRSDIILRGSSLKRPTPKAPENFKTFPNCLCQPT